jgi:hypothetical protein
MGAGYGQQMGAGYGRRDFAASGGGELSGWKATRSALWLLSIGVTIKLISFAAYIVVVALMFLAMGALFLSMLDQMGSRRPSPFGSSGADAGAGLIIGLGCVMILILLAVLAARILDIIGTIFLLQVPESVGTKGLAVTALICQCVVLGSPLVYCAGAGLQAPLIAIMFYPLAWGAMLVSTIMILMLLHKVGRHLSSEALCKQVVRFAIWWGVGVGLMALSSCAAFGVGFAVGASSGPSPTMGYTIIALIVGIFLVNATAVTVVYVMLNQLYSLANRVILRQVVSPEYG